MFILIIPSIIIILPIIGFLMFYIFNQRAPRRKVILAGLITLLLGLITPILATIVSANGIAANAQSGDMVCSTGAATFLFFGYVITFIGTPILTLILTLSAGRAK